MKVFILSTLVLAHETIETTVIRTERFVHKDPSKAEPVVDERTVTKVVRDNATVEEVVSERQSLPLNDFEKDHWMRDEGSEAEAIFQNSREAMIINEFQETPGTHFYNSSSFFIRSLIWLLDFLSSVQPLLI